METVGIGDSLVRSRAAARPGALCGNGSMAEVCADRATAVKHAPPSRTDCRRGGIPAGSTERQDEHQQDHGAAGHPDPRRSEEHTSELQSPMRITSAAFSLKKKKLD